MLHHQGGGHGQAGPDLYHSGSLLFDRVGSKRVHTSAMHGLDDMVQEQIENAREIVIKVMMKLREAVSIEVLH